MPAALTPAELTILGLLEEQPRHGYELEQVIEERGIRQWTALGFSSIYYVLDKLAKRKLIETIGPATSGKARATFRVTPTGHKLGAAESLASLATLTPLRASVLVGIANSPALHTDAIAAALSSRAADLESQLSGIRQARASQQPLPFAASAIFDYSEAMLEADAKWTTTTLAMLMKETAMDNKYDLKKAHKMLYSPNAKDFSVVAVPELTYIAIDGHGDPNTSREYAEAVEALYGVAYAVKFESKKALERDFVVGPLEGLWRSDDMSSFVTRDKSAWNWTMMIGQPDWITVDMVATAVDKTAAKKNLAALERVRLLTVTEGISIQILHIGSYDDEAPTLERLHNEYMLEQGLAFNGSHHEIYLSDARRTAPEKLKTILRQPVKMRG